MPCSCDAKCKTRAAMELRHGTPRQFEQAVWRAYAEHGGIDEAHAAIAKYDREWRLAR